MPLTAPEHLRGRLGKGRTDLQSKRGAWIMKSYRAGHPFDEIAKALGIRYDRVLSIANANGYRRGERQLLKTLHSQGIILGKPGEAYDILPIPAREKLADTAAKHGKPMLHVLADFWAQHHGAQA